MNKLAAALALMTFLIAGGWGLDGQADYTLWKNRLDEQESKCAPTTPGDIDSLTCNLEAIQLESYQNQAKETRNLSFALAIGGPVVIWLFVLLWRAASPKIRKEAIRGAKVGLIAVDELSKRSTRAVGTMAKLSDSAQGRTRECPFCAEMIKPHAKVCRHCGKDVA